MRNVVFLNSFAGIWAHTSTEARLMSELSKQGHAVSQIICDGILDGRCNVRASRQRNIQQSNSGIDCKDCMFTAKLIGSSLNGQNIETLRVSSFLDKGDFAQAESLASSSITNDSDKLFFEGFEVGKIASYEVILTHKILDEAYSEEALWDLKAATKNVILSIKAATKIFQQLPKDTILVVRNAQYSINHSFVLVAAKLGFSIVCIDASPNISEAYTHVNTWQWSPETYTSPAGRNFVSKTSERHLRSKKSTSRIMRHLQALESAKSYRVYSQRKNHLDRSTVFEKLGKHDSKNVLLVALSSTDEPLASKKIGAKSNLEYPGSVFESQMEWVKSLIDWSKSRQDTLIVIRVHPREFPNDRNPIKSQMARLWEEILTDLPSSVVVNHPKQGLSIYDLFEITSVITTGWSSVGVEACMKGIPLVLYDAKLPSYPPELGMSGNSKTEYFKNLEFSLNSTPDQEQIIELTHAWLNFQMIESTIMVGGRLFERIRYRLPRFVNLILEGADRYLYFVYRPLDLFFGKFRTSDGGNLLNNYPSLR